VPLVKDVKDHQERGQPLSPVDIHPLFMGQVVGLVDQVKPAKDIVEEMVRDAIETMEQNRSLVVAKL